ncbi:MAG: InlB B-repeat-containing protein [Parabacteroides sp.]|nr:InlB B-repeat-containing protein [Parabacteroides sp.]
MPEIIWVLETGGGSAGDWATGGSGGNCGKIDLSGSLLFCNRIGWGKPGSTTGHSSGYGQDGYYTNGDPTYASSLVNTTLYGDVTILFDIEVDDLTFNDSQTVTISQGKTLVVNENKTLKGTGTIAGEGTLLFKSGAKKEDGIIVENTVSVIKYCNMQFNIPRDGRYWEGAWMPVPALLLSKNAETYSLNSQWNWNRNQFFNDILSGTYTIAYDMKDVDNSWKDKIVNPNNNVSVTFTDDAVIDLDNSTVSFDLNGGNGNAPSESIVLTKVGDTFTNAKISIPEGEFKRDYYAFEGWYNGETLITDNEVVITAPTTFKAHWTLNEIGEVTTAEVSGTYGKILTATNTFTLPQDVETICGGIKSYQLKDGSNLPAGLSINSENGQICGTPEAVTGSNGVKAIITLTALNGATKDVEVTFKIVPMEVTVTPDPNQTLFAGGQEGTITYTHTGFVDGDKVTFDGALSYKDENGKHIIINPMLMVLFCRGRRPEITSCRSVHRR